MPKPCNRVKNLLPRLKKGGCQDAYLPSKNPLLQCLGRAQEMGTYAQKRLVAFHEASLVVVVLHGFRLTLRCMKHTFWPHSNLFVTQSKCLKVNQKAVEAGSEHCG